MPARPALLTLVDLPLELLVHIGGAVEDARDRASLCLALPPLGVTLMRHADHPEYRELIFAVAMHLATVADAVIDEALLRKYAKEGTRRASRAALSWHCWQPKMLAQLITFGAKLAMAPSGLHGSLLTTK